jgi:A/G-specific adenine glycosylase
MRNYILSGIQQDEVKWFRRNLRKWFKENHRTFFWRETIRTPYEILIAEILLRRTRAETVAQIYPKFLKKYSNFNRLASAKPAEIKRIIKPLGLWRQKTPIFLNIAKAVVENNGQLPSNREDLEKLFHIGNYIASVILTSFHGKAEPFVDVNMARVVDRFFGPRKLVDIRYDPYLHAVAREIVKNKKESLTLNWAVLDFAALVCKAGRPRCEICPMRPRCFYFNNLEGTNL